MALAGYTASAYLFPLGVILGKSAEAARVLADAFFRLAPADKRKRMNEADWASSIKRFHIEAKEIRGRYGLGFIGRARTVFNFQKRMLEAGLPADTVRKVVFSLMLNSFTSDK